MKARRRRTRRKARVAEEVELNMAAMLDMAFQLLAFFILTFQPSGVETQISMRMPKVASVTQGSVLEELTPEEDFELAYPLVVNVNGGDNGISEVIVGSEKVSGFNSDTMLQSVGDVVSRMLQKGTIDQIQIQVSEELRYESLIQLIDVCTKQRLPSGEPMSNISINTIKGSL